MATPPARAPYLFPESARLGRDNVVLQARARRHVVDGFAGPLSIKTVLAGRVSWTVGGRELVVDPCSFLILNAGDVYSMNIDATEPVETCCVFFAPGFVERIALDKTCSLAAALDQPDRPAPTLPYLTALHTSGERALVTLVQALAPLCKQALAPSGFEEAFLETGAGLLGYYEEIREQTARAPAIRESTRRELHRRLLIGRDYLHARSSGPVSLREAAREACLSPFHFHRGFREVFQRTPHAYLTALRMDRARLLLEAGSSVVEACFDVGFASTSAFSRAFRAAFGEPPSAVRRKFARSDKRFA